MHQSESPKIKQSWLPEELKNKLGRQDSIRYRGIPHHSDANCKIWFARLIWEQRKPKGTLFYYQKNNIMGKFASPDFPSPPFPFHARVLVVDRLPREVLEYVREQVDKLPPNHLLEPKP